MDQKYSEMKWYCCCLLLLFTCTLSIGQENPLSLPPSLQRKIPFDFEELATPPAFQWESQTDSVWSLIYEGGPFDGSETEVFAYFASPKTLGEKTKPGEQFPGIVLIHGGGGTAFRVWAMEWAKRGYTAIAMDLGGSRPAPMEEQNHLWGTKSERLSQGGPPQNDTHKFYHINAAFTEHWQFHSISNIIRAHSLLRSFPETNPDETVVTGISWGGYLTSIVAGIDHRFSAAVPVYGCGFLYEKSVWLNRFDSLGTAASQKWQNLWDPSQYVPNIQSEILFINGTNDFAYPVESWQKTVEITPKAAQLMIPQMRHNHEYGAKPKEIAHFMNAQKDLPKISIPRRKGSRFVSSIKQGQSIQSATLVFTTEEAPNKERKWETLPAQIKKNRIKAEMEVDTKAAYFLVEYGDDSLRLSGPIWFKGN